ncbi:ABC transporter ATP-binding protein [Nakamurella leprariae]|uniref:Sn-glycerol-3-phosphate ABC transporter ATP-binding protein UgpC n=1 Tax=Nakamurella leprariae TaxID=2803911 RepID=A0A938YAN4_9ACTN|nr:sn-glycerol-3-phosphate ABC transporter ATP-binding protein UgpC [Nakamurella leprariae]MBM9469036.1 sn-glycerol-3-phosphate ABC transporter ATP-binding protein UgpC [Nakamurella leprariae]
MGEIVLDAVRKTYGKTLAVEDLTYTVGEGQFVTLLGPSGCGKSTTLNMIAGLEDISGGSITIDGRRVDELPPDKRDLAFVFQDYALYPHMTVYNNMAFGLKMRKTPKDQIEARVRDAARRLSIEPFLDRKPKELSGGQRQRVALGRAIARRPSVFLFDEPLSNLDALLRDQTRTELKQLHRDLGATSVYVTHDQEEALTLSDRIAVMSKGHLEQYGSPEEIYHHPATEFVASFVGKPRMNLWTATRVADGYQVPGTELVVPVPRGAELPQTVRLGLRPDEIGIAPDDAGIARVRLVEPIGNATDVILDLGPERLTARLTGFGHFTVGQPVSIDVSAARLHLFDTATGLRLPV